MKKIFVFALIGLLLIGFVIAHGENTFAEAEEIIKQKISCEELTNEQLEILGEYYMEQMHPGELHEIMDEQMGGDGSESLRQVHINMGRAFYCGEHEAMSGNMMDMMMGRGMMSGGNGMMNSRSSGMMGDYYRNSMGAFGWLFWILAVVILVLLIIWLIKQLQEKPKRKRR